MNNPQFRSHSLLLLAILALTAGWLHAAPYGPEGRPAEWTQPDGTKLNLRVFGDEFYGRTETTDGYTVVFNPTTKAYYYATLSPDGDDFASSGKVVGKADPRALGIGKGIEINPTSRAAKARKKYEALESVVKQQERWDALKAANRNYESFKKEVKKQEKAGKKGFVIPMGTVFPDSEIPAAPKMASPSGGDGSGSGDPPVAPAPPSFTLSGDVVGLTILIDFSDVPGTVVTQAQVDDYCNKPNYTGFSNAGSVYDYFLIQSGGKMRYNNNVTYYVRVPQPKSYYNNTSTDCGLCGRLILNDALNILIANGYDFSQLTTKSVSGQNRVRACNIFFAGADSGVWSFGLWPHRWVLASPKSVGGGKYISDYQITNIGTTASLKIGTFCHENGHMVFGYPDLYSYDSNAANMGNYSLMAGGNYGGNPAGTHPVNIDPCLKEASGWMDVIDLNSSSNQRCTIQADGNQVYRYLNPSKATEYFLFELRDNTGYEGPYGGQSGSVNPGTGLVAYHVYETGSNPYSSILTASNPNCTYTKPYEMMLVEANQKTTITPWYDDPTPDTSDAFKASGKSSLSDTTTPDLKFWNPLATGGGRLTNSGCNINTISADSNIMTFVAGAGALGSTPSIVLSRSTLNAYCNFGTNAASQTFTICNGQGNTLNYTVSDNQTWLSCTPASGSVTTGNSLITINYATSGLAAGTYAATITVTDPAASPTTKTIVVSLTITAQPVMSLSPVAISKSGTAGLSGPQASFTIINTGGGAMNYTASEPVSWLSLSSTSGSVVAETDTIYVNFDATSLAIGTYNSTITVTSAEASNSPLTIPVTFTVGSSDMIVTAPNGGEQWGKGVTKAITWLSGLGGNVKIELLKGGALNSTISASTQNNGTFNWSIPGAQAAASDYTVRITSIESPAKSDTSDAAFSILPTLADALDATGLTWTTSGNLPWFAQSTTAHDGIDAAQSGAIGDSQTSSVETTLTGPGTLTFWWKVSSEAGYDFLEFYLNNTIQTGNLAKIAGEVAWVQKTVSIPSGNQTVKWTYKKDVNTPGGADAAWVDEVAYTPSSAPEIAVEQPVGTDLVDGSASISCGSVNVGGSSSPVTFTVKNLGTADLTGLAVSKDGANSADFTVGALGATTLTPGGSTTFTVTFSPSATGSRTAAIHIANNDANENPFDIALTGTGIGPGTLAVTPAGGLTSSGIYGGSFSPSSLQFTLNNPGGTSINWTAAKTASWVTLDVTSGTLTAGASAPVTVTINSGANSLNVGAYSDTVSFTNTTSGTGNSTRGVALTVNPLPATVTLGNLSQTYDGSAKSVSVTTNPAGLAKSVTYNGSATAPTNAGTYAVVATVTEPNYQGSASGSLVIAHTVSYQGNGNTSGTVPADQTKFQGVDLTLATNSGNLNKTDYSFVGWNTAADGSGTDYAAGAIYSGNASLVLYAKWTPGADGTWTQTTAGPFDWGTAANWSGGTVAAGADRTAFFTPNITADQTVNLDTPRTIGNITFTDSTTSSNNLQISGANILTLARTSGVPVIDVTQSGRTLTISSVISGSNGVKKNGAGTASLTVNNLYTGGTTINEGTLATTADANLGTGGAITVTGTSTWNMGAGVSVIYNRDLAINSGTLTLNSGNASKTVTGVLSGSGGIVGGNSTGYIFSNTGNTFTGTVNSGYQMDFASLGDSSNNINIVGSNGNFNWTGGAKTFALRPFTLNASGTGNINNIGTGLLTIQQALAITGAAGARTLNLATIAGNSISFSGNLADGGGSVLSLTASAASNAGSSNGGTVSLSGTNTYSGVTTLTTRSNGGNPGDNTLVIQGKQALSPNTSVVFSRGNNGSLGIKLLDDGVGTISMPTNFTHATTGNPTFFVGNNNTANGGTSTGSTTGSTIALGNLTLGTSGLTYNITGANGYRLQFNDVNLPTVTGAVAVTFNPTTAPLTIAGAVRQASSANTGALTTTLGGTSAGNAISGNLMNSADATQRVLNITKTSTSIWTLFGNNTYTGTTTVSQGTLALVGGSQTSAITVSTGASLGFTLGSPTTSTAAVNLTTGTVKVSGAPNGTSDYPLMTLTGGATFTGTPTLNSAITGYTLQLLSGNTQLVLMADFVGPGPVASFSISAFSSPQTVGTPISGITLTAKDASNNTATSFTGTVTFGGSGGFNGTSAAFVSGVLNGVSVTPTVSGSNLTFTVNDGASHTGSATITTIQTKYAAWAGGADFASDANGDGLKNGLAWLLGATDPSAHANALLPVASSTAGNLRLTFRCLKSTKRGGTQLKLQTSNDVGQSDLWISHEAAVPDVDSTVNGVLFDTTDDGDYIKVIADIPSGSGKLFVRLNAVAP